jgi:hypothetical protein
MRLLRVSGVWRVAPSTAKCGVAMLVLATLFSTAACTGLEGSRQSTNADGPTHSTLTSGGRSFMP